MRPQNLISTASLATVLVLGNPHHASAQFYVQRNLVSDGAVPAELIDPDLVNAWGLAASATSPWWVSDNGTSLSTLYNGNTGAKVALVVNIPASPTGVVFNTAGAGFLIPSGAGSAPARFIFAGEDGTIWGWRSGTEGHLAVDNSGSGAVYKGLAIATTQDGTFLYVTNFHDGTVERYDENFKRVAGGFEDPTIPPGYAPFGIQNIGGVIYVTYALQDADRHDDVAGMGHGFVNAFDATGTLIRRVASRGTLNSPWGLAMAPGDFGFFSDQLLVGNFGDGLIHAFDPTKFRVDGEYQQREMLHSADGKPLRIDGLWALEFGNGGSAGPTNVLFFTAGPFGESHGLFGSLTPIAPQDKRR